MITEELRALITAGGITPDHTVLNQLVQALPGALASRPEMARLLTTNGYQKFPGGLILQWGSVTTSASADIGFTFPIAFPNAILGRLVSPQNGFGSSNATAMFGAETLSAINVGSYTASTGARTSQVVSIFVLGR